MRRTHRAWRRTLQLLVVAVSPVLAPPASAQQPDTGGTAALLLRVRDRETGHPVVGAEVVALGTRVKGFSDDSGRVDLAVPGGRHRLDVTSLGYVPKHVTVTVSPGGAADVDVRLEVSAIPLRGVDVPVARRSAVLEREGFYSRQRFSGTGSFLWGDQLAARVRKSSYLADLFRDMKGFGVRAGRSGTGHVLVSTRGVNSLSLSCYPTIYLDGINTGWAARGAMMSGGMPSTPGAGSKRPNTSFTTPSPASGSTSTLGMDIDLIVAPSDVIGIEAYPRSADALEFPSGTCGVVLVWTRRGPDPEAAPRRK